MTTNRYRVERVSNTGRVNNLLKGVSHVLRRTRFQANVRHEVEDNCSLLLYVREDSQGDRHLLIFVNGDRFLNRQGTTGLARGRLKRRRAIFDLNGLRLHLIRLCVCLRAVYLNNCTLLGRLIGVIIRLFRRISMTNNRLMLLLRQGNGPMDLICTMRNLLNLRIRVVIYCLLASIYGLINDRSNATRVSELTRRRTADPRITNINTRDVCRTLSSNVTLLLSGTSFLIRRSSSFLYLFENRRSLTCRVNRRIINVTNSSACSIKAWVTRY